MRILGFSKKWGKLKQPEFTTFRHPRGDKDWYIGEQVRVVFQPRRKGGGEILGVAEIVKKEIRELDSFFTDGVIVKPTGVKLVTDTEAIADGFASRFEMGEWMEHTYGLDFISRMNKLTLRWFRVDRNPR